MTGKWLVFWIAGMRLLAAGIKQMRGPAAVLGCALAAMAVRAL